MFLNLVKNEWLKQFKQKGVVVGSVLLIVLAGTLPLGLNALYESEISKENLIETERRLEILRGEMNDNPSDEKEKVMDIIQREEESYLLLAQETQLETQDWRSELVARYRRDSLTLSFMEAVEDGISISDILRYGYNFDYETIENIGLLSESQRNSQIAVYKEQLAVYRTIIKENDYREGIALYMAWMDENVANTIKKIEEIERDTDKDEMEKTSLIESLTSSNMLELANKAVLEYRLANEIYYEKQNWKNKALLEITALNAKLHEKRISESDFYTYGVSHIDDYAMYNEVFDTKNNSRQERIDTLWQSLENNTPPMTIHYDARVATYVTMEVLVICTTLFIIFIGGGIVSSEFSRGTIRMLLSRPVNRGAIYLAKFTMLLGVGVGTVLIGGLVTSLVSGAIHGFMRMGIDYFFGYLLGEIVISLGGMLVVIALLIMLSTVTKSTVVTVGSVMILYILAAPLSALLAPFGFVGYTLLPYLNVGALRLVPFIRDSFWAMGIQLNLQLGFFGMLILAILFLLIGYYVFVKKDVKN